MVEMVVVDMMEVVMAVVVKVVEVMGVHSVKCGGSGDVVVL